MTKKIWIYLLMAACASSIQAEPNCTNGDPTNGWGNPTPEDEEVCAKGYYENLLKSDPDKFFESCKLNDCPVKWNDAAIYAAASNVLGAGHDPNKNLRDDKTTTAWAAKWENQKNLTIAIKVKSKNIAGFSIANGYQKTPEDFANHGAIKTLTIYHDAVTDANKVGTFEIKKETDIQYFAFDKLLKGAGKLFCRIEEVHEGEAGTVSASELRVWGN
jgi:hypothetical protein